MAKVVGVGAVVLHAIDAEILARWYAEMLGIETRWSTEARCYFGSIGPTIFGILPAKEQIAPGPRAVMVNYRVDDYASFCDTLRARGALLEDTIEDDFGRYAHLHDPEGNPIEIWQPHDPEEA